MSIVVNGTTIPENVANALNVNGTNITSVVCNGTTVWTQSLIVREPATGEYLIVDNTVWYFGLGTPQNFLYWNGISIPMFLGTQNYYVYDGWTYYKGAKNYALSSWVFDVHGIYRIKN